MSAIGGGVKALADANSKKTKAEIHLADATAASRTSEAETAATIAKNKGSFVASPGASAPVVFNPGTRQAAMTGLINARKK